MKREIGFALKHSPLARTGGAGFLIIFLFSLTSCYTYGPLLQPGDPVPVDWQKETQYYIPTVFNVPMLDSAELAALSFNARTASGTDGYGIDAAVRILPNWAVMGNYGSCSIGD